MSTMLMYMSVPSFQFTGPDWLEMGIGLDRMLMLRKGIDDIRVLRSGDPRIVQMLDREPYQPVSDQPAIERHLSIAVDSTVTAEELGDRVRGVLGARCNSVEEIAVVSEANYLDLPPAARARCKCLRP